MVLFAVPFVVSSPVPLAVLFVVSNLALLNSLNLVELGSGIQPEYLYGKLSIWFLLEVTSK